MPRLKKRRNVPAQRKPKKDRPKQSCANSSLNLDHSYNMHDKLPLPCLQEEMDTKHIKSDIEDQSDHQYNMFVARLQEEMDTKHIKSDIEDQSDHQYNMFTARLQEEMDTKHIQSDIEDQSDYPYNTHVACLQEEMVTIKIESDIEDQSGHPYNTHVACLQEEMVTIKIESDIEDQSVHPYNTHVACLQEEMDTINVQPDVEDKNDHSYNQHDVSTTLQCLQKEIETIHMYTQPDIEDIKRKEIVKSDPISSSLPFENLKNCLQNNISKSYMLNQNSDNIQIFQVYSSSDNVSVKMNVTINQNFMAKVFVHRIELSSDHHLWFGLAPTVYDSVIRIQSLLSKLDSYSVCVGNYDNDLPAPTNCQGFRESDFGAVRGSISYSSTVRSIKCALLVQGNRCFMCSQLRRVLISREYRHEERQRKIQDSSSKPDYLHSKMQHSNMSRQQLIDKINQQKVKINILQSEIVQTRHQFPLEITSEGVT